MVLQQDKAQGRTNCPSVPAASSAQLLDVVDVLYHQLLSKHHAIGTVIQARPEAIISAGGAAAAGLLEACSQRCCMFARQGITAEVDEAILPEVGLICRVQALPACFMVVAVGVKEGTELKVL
jgi:hypothetical protein